MVRECSFTVNIFTLQLMNPVIRAPPRKMPNLKEDELNIYPSQSRLYHFPDIGQLGKEFGNVQQINQKLDILLKNHNLLNPNNKIEKTLVTRQVEGGWIFKCKIKDCLAFLKFNFTADAKLMLTKSDIEHEHKLNNRMCKGRLPKVKNSEIEECYDQLQLLNFRPGEIFNFIRIRFKISKPQYYAIKYGRNKRETIKNLLMTLSKYDHFYFQCKDLQQLAAYYRNQRLRPQKRQDRDVVIVVSRRMKQLYENYHGQYVLFSIFPELVLETRYTKKLKYHNVGILYGEDANGNANLLFGVIFMRKSIRLAYLYILEKLFNFLGKYPKIIITDFEPHLTMAIRRLQKRTMDTQNTIQLHLQLPNSFITHTFQSRTSPQFLSILSNDLEGLLRESDRKKHEQRLKVILKACELNPPAAQERIVEQIKKYVRGNSIIYLPPLFIGLSVTPYSVATQLRSRVLDFFKSPRPMVLAIKAFFEIFQAYPVLKYLTKQQIQARLNPPKQCSTKKEKIQLFAHISKTYDSSTKLKSVSKNLSQNAALCFQDSLQKCFMGQLEMMKTSNHISYRALQTQQNYPYVINHLYEMRQGERVKIWRCNCHYYAKTGLPCWHQIKVCLQQKSNLILQISPFWLKDTRANNQKKGYIIEHDIKYWNDADLTKLGVQSRQKEENIFHNGNDTIGDEGISNNGEYNIKINKNSEDDEISMNSNQGLSALINELQGIQWKENDQQQDDLNNWKENLPSQSDNKSQRSRLYSEDYGQNINFDQESYANSLSNNTSIQSQKSVKKSNGSQQRSNQPKKQVNNEKLKQLKANNHQYINGFAKNQPRKIQNRDFNNDGLADLEGLNSSDLISQKSKGWNDYHSSKFDASSQSQYSSSKAHAKFEPWKNIFDDPEEDKQSINDDRYQGNSQENSQEQWQRKSLDRSNMKEALSKQDMQINLEDLNFDLVEESQRYMEFDKDYFQVESVFK